MEEQVKTVPNIYQLVLGVMSDLSYIQKGDKKVNDQYRFVSHDKVAEQIHDLLVKWGICTIPTVAEMVQEGNRTVVKLNVSFVNAACPSDNFTVQFPGYGIDGGDKGPGKAVSYAFKYALLKQFVLATGDDPDMDQKAVYDPPKCLEFEAILPADLSEKDRTKLNNFLAHSAESLQKHIEDVKREAVSRPADFLKAFNNWKGPKKEK